MKKHHDKTARHLDELKEGQPVYHKPFPEARWKHLVINEKQDDRSYTGKNRGGHAYC